MYVHKQCLKLNLLIWKDVNILPYTMFLKDFKPCAMFNNDIKKCNHVTFEFYSFYINNLNKKLWKCLQYLVVNGERKIVVLYLTSFDKYTTFMQWYNENYDGM